MIERCIMCQEEFFNHSLHESRCIQCWVKIANYAKYRYTQNEQVEQAEGEGHASAHHLLIERRNYDVASIPNPYNAQTENACYGAFQSGVARRLGEWHLFLVEQDKVSLGHA